MERGQGLDVVEWQNLPPTPPLKKRSRRSFIPPAYFGILGTLLLHGLALHSLPFGQSSHAKPPEEPHIGGARSGVETDEPLVLLNLPAAANAGQIATYNFALPPLNFNKLKMIAVAVVDPPVLPNLTLPLHEDQPSVPANGSGDTAEQARLFGGYMGQIQARIERAWRRPRSPINEGSSTATANVGETFQCQVQILQDWQGNVQEVLLLSCNGSQKWRRSLVAAIQRASPLPAPPNETVFNQSVTLDFLALQFAPDSPDDEYELPRRNFAQVAE